MGPLCPLNDFLSIGTERENNTVFSQGVILELLVGIMHYTCRETCVRVAMVTMF